MLTKEECEKALLRFSSPYYASIDVQEKYHDCNGENYSIKEDCATLEQLIKEHFKLVKENERLLSQLVECQRVCQLKQERINELEKGTVSYVD